MPSYGSTVVSHDAHRGLAARLGRAVAGAPSLVVNYNDREGR